VIVVSQDGKGDFTSIQKAIDGLSDNANSERVIYIKNGTYNEKVFIEKNFVTLKGENREKTILKISLARDQWRCENTDDWGTATINLKGNDITLENLTVRNDYGFNAPEEVSIDCANDTVTNNKKIKKDSHQMALRSFSTTRLIARNCNFIAGGGDTVSPWNKENGMFYFQNCTMEGGVDFYCPRGWAYAENCKFICHNLSAAIWHDGSEHKDSKTVLKNCEFIGDPNFKLGRYHWDSQFFLINCIFPSTMADAKIYFVAPNGRELKWGERVYYYNCRREGGDYEWHKDNLAESGYSADPNKIDAAWTFTNKWNPAKSQ
jgi:pectin methylesterase-like acyl-CoA thioesterase